MDRRLASPSVCPPSHKAFSSSLIAYSKDDGWPSHHREKEGRRWLNLGVGGETYLEPTTAAVFTGYVLGIVCNALLYQAARSAGDLVV